MKEIVFDRKKYSSYKDFYTQIYKDLNGKNIIDWENYPDLDYFAGMLDEFMWYCSERSIKYIFKNFDRAKIKLQKNYDDYEYNMIIEIFENFVKKHPNNKLEFIMDE